jgi:hypothetical protein
MMPNAVDYASIADHPLRAIPQTTLGYFRHELRKVMLTGDMQISNDEMVDPIADALLMSAIEALDDRRHITLPWCIRCGALIVDNSTCLRAPDGGVHEGYNGPPFAVRQGHSLHENGCPRACPLPDFDPICTCRRVRS